MIPISTVRLGHDVADRVLEVIRSGVIAQGPVVAEFEAEFAQLSGVEHAIAVNNGTTALVAALQVLDLEPGDEVVTTPFTFAATLNAILEAGATVRFADIGAEDFCIDPLALNAQITDRTRVVMPVHLYGQAADMVAISRAARQHELTVIEDAAQAHGARVDGETVGGYGLGCFSFYATKNLTTGEGGIITTNDDELAARLRILRNQGMKARYQYVMAGHNYRLTDLQAALVLPQLKQYPQQLQARRQNARTLTGLLSDVEGLVLPQELPGREHVWHQYTILLPGDVDRDAFVDSLAARGVGSGIYYPKLVHDYDVYRSHPRVLVSQTPVAADVAARCVSLPVHPYLADGDVDVIATAVRDVIERR